MADFYWFAPIKDELDKVEEELTYAINTELKILQEASTHLVKAGGKRLRPAFVLLSAKLYQDSLAETIPMAVAIELIHMASLVHDDVIDNSSMRRGRETVKEGWGNRVSIYVGNYVLARALSLVSAYQRSDILQVISQASMSICEGEITQMINAYNVQQGLKDYLRRIEKKTALLISISCELGGMISSAPLQEIRALKRYGYYLGMAFQITDDILDFVADEKILGKPVGSDIKQGILTLPAIYALKFDEKKDQLRQLLLSPQLCIDRAEEIIDIVIKSQGIDYAYNVSCKFARKAQQQLNFLPDVPVKNTLYNIAANIAERQY